VAAIIGRKVGMTQIFGEDGARVPLTVIEAGPCPVTQVKTVETDGYDAVQLGFGAAKPKALNSPKLGHPKKAGARPCATSRVLVRGARGRGLGRRRRHGRAVRAGPDGPHHRTSKGKGCAGTIKRHNFKRGPKSHGSPASAVRIDRRGLPGAEFRHADERPHGLAHRHAAGPAGRGPRPRAQPALVAARFRAASTAS
jgi:50S ribosomal protein uL3